MDDVVSRSRALWAHLAGAPVEFRPGGFGVVVSGQSLLCPPGWIGLVTIAGSGIATVPDAGFVGVVAGLPTDRAILDALRTHPVLGSQVSAFPAVGGTLGPAALAYLDPADFRTVLPDGGTVERLPAGHPDLDALSAAATPEEVGEAGLADIESDMFVVRDGSRIIAAAGYERWLGLVAHLCVLTAADARGRGLARVAASAAVTEALREGLLPQWRAVPEPSRRVARALGFRELGSQLSVLPLR